MDCCSASLIVPRCQRLKSRRPLLKPMESDAGGCSLVIEYKTFSHVGQFHDCDIDAILLATFICFVWVVGINSPACQPLLLVC